MGIVKTEEHVLLLTSVNATQDGLELAAQIVRRYVDLNWCPKILYSTDVNECANSDANSCQYHEHCVDNQGSYTCNCPSGYNLNTDGLTCSRKQSTRAQSSTWCCVLTRAAVCTGNCHGRGTCTSPNLCDCTTAGWTGNDCTTGMYKWPSACGMTLQLLFGNDVHAVARHHIINYMSFM